VKKAKAEAFKKYWTQQEENFNRGIMPYLKVD